MARWLNIFAVLFVGASVAAGGQATAAQPEKDITPLAQGQVLRGKFEQIRSLKGFGAPLKSTGSFTLVSERGLIWRTEAPFATTAIMSPNGIVQQTEGVETVRLPAARIPFMARLYDMLSGALGGDWRALSNSFAITRRDAGKNWHLTLVPLKADDANMPFQSIEVSGRKFVEAIDMSKPNGDHDKIVLVEQKVDAAPLTQDEESLLDQARQQ